MPTNPMTAAEQIAAGQARRDLEDPYRPRGLADGALDNPLPATRNVNADGSGEGQVPGRPA